jgi:hypothetical protein
MKNERGIVLIMVIWALTILMVLAIELARTMRVEGLTAATYHEEVETIIWPWRVCTVRSMMLQRSSKGNRYLMDRKSRGLQRGLTSETSKSARMKKKYLGAR